MKDEPCSRCGAVPPCPCAEVDAAPDDAPVRVAWRSLRYADVRGVGAPMPKAVALAHAENLNRFYSGAVAHYLTWPAAGGDDGGPTDAE